jgi:hypothetical protein
VSNRPEEPDRARTGPPWARRDRYAPEPQHILGFPADMFGGVDREFFRSFVHPVKAYKRWARRRRLGPYAVDEDDADADGPK